ncbi:hypothetical protein RRU94_11965 [Domibacillus sp. DTU_2020_1001157_1_SI_ALB_TIR_016]|uniref:hypothetical protein n=1 Tax=Domibacillus sp. DTU_2020_1001157_1_SI_ALB_TIR_016 TaxID=3077789 RepID=UPI0028F10C97|nr:hypothetical protein [Domibacillus sp. DTU_2020_1001157_1_SI_ALB_TIR_016]WNS81505.1 hypothetical protein RRU94_11965 [Domibacillus sp. DTU_2020_1001157_1_SI_ALB_TIR_016]
MYAGKVLIWAVYVWILTKFILLKHIPSLHLLEMADGSWIARRWKEADVMPFHTIGLFLAPSNLPLFEKEPVGLHKKSFLAPFL